MQDPASHLDGEYAAFGKMLDDEESSKTLDAIAMVPTDTNKYPTVEQKIKSITVETFGYEYAVVKIEE